MAKQSAVNQELTGRSFFKVNFFGPNSKAVVKEYQVTKTWGADHVMALDVTPGDGWKSKNEGRHAIKGLAWSVAEAWQNLMVQRSVRLGSLQADVREAEDELAAILAAMKTTEGTR